MYTQPPWVEVAGLAATPLSCPCWRQEVTTIMSHTAVFFVHHSCQNLRLPVRPRVQSSWSRKSQGPRQDRLSIWCQTIPHSYRDFFVSEVSSLRHPVTIITLVLCWTTVCSCFVLFLKHLIAYSGVSLLTNPILLLAINRSETQLWVELGYMVSWSRPTCLIFRLTSKQQGSWHSDLRVVERDSYGYSNH
jgi:hypothetical protein